MKKNTLSVVLLLGAIAFPPARSQDAGKTQFTVIRGKDTLAVERFTRDAGTLAGLLSASNGVKNEYVANLRPPPDERVEHIELQRTNIQGQSVTLSVDFGDTLVAAQIQAGAQSQKMSLATQLKPMPFLINSFALLEQIVRASHVEEGKPVKWAAARLGAGDTATITISRATADTVLLSAPNGDVKLAVSKNGDVTGAVFAAQQWVVVRSVVKP